MIKLRQNSDKLSKAAHAARLAQIQAAAAIKKFEVAREESRAAKRAFKAAKKAAKKAKRSARKAGKLADRTAARVIALRNELKRAEKKSAKPLPRTARKVTRLPRSRFTEPAPAAPDLAGAAALVPADSVSNN